MREPFHLRHLHIFGLAKESIEYNIRVPTCNNIEQYIQTMSEKSLKFHNDQSTRTGTSTIDLVQVEHEAQQVVRTITNCINAIRAIDAFQPTTVKSVLDPNEPTGVVRPKKIIQSPKEVELVYLFQLMEENGLQKQVEDVCSFRPTVNMCSPTKDNFICGDAISSNYHPMERDRQRLVYEVFLPLLEALGQLFRILDDEEAKTPPSSVPVPGKDASDEDIKDRIVSRRKKKPDAPRGLLSLSNYTDIACLLELVICTGILPLLERHVQSPVVERTRHLPKSLAGRLHRKSLLWGMDTLNYKPHANTNKASDDLTARQARAAMNIDRASKELTDVIVTISNVLVLDRFRPMLLPRHATDVYSGVFQLERLMSIRKTFNFPVAEFYDLGQNEMPMNLVRRIFLHSTTGVAAGTAHPQDSLDHLIKTEPIDMHTMVNSYQTLLLSGRDAPSWLKVRLSNLLTSLATTSADGLQAIVDIFVVAASSLPTEQITSASSRLARVLCVKAADLNNHDSLIYYKALFDQFMALLDFKDLSLSDMSNPLDARAVACVLTVWSVLDNLPKEVTRLFYRRLVMGLMPSSDSTQFDSLQSSVRRIHSLLLFTPTGGNAVENLCLSLLSDIDLGCCRDVDAPGNISALGQLIRIVCARGDQLMHSDIVTEARVTIHLITHTVLQKWNHAGISTEQYLAVSLIKSVATSPLDELGYFFQRGSNGDTSMDLTLEQSNDNLVACLLTDMETRSLFVLTGIISSGLQDTQDPAQGNEAESKTQDAQLLCSIQRLAGAFFKLQLLIYFESTKTENKFQYLPKSIANNIDEFKIVSMVMLPLLCEKCSPGALLMERTGSSSESSGVLSIISLIVISTSVQFGNQSELNSNAVLKLNSRHCDFSGFDLIPGSFASLSTATSHYKKGATVEVDVESQLSITSIVLALLVAILELGSNNRSQTEENYLQLLIPHLTVLSMLGDIPSQNHNRVDSSYEDELERSAPIVLKAEIAEMASHATALIQARSLKDLPDNDSIPAEVSLFDYIRMRTKEVETHLASEQPPLRAHAVVQLRKLARGALEGMKRSKAPIPTRSLIVELGDRPVPKEESPTSLLPLVEDMLRVCIVSLEDTESYVYLASIHTLVAIVDECPSHFMPIVINGITTGNLKLQADDSSIDNNEHATQLSPDQRIKLIEAMNFIIRRRGPAIQSYSTLVMNAILYGSNRISDTQPAQDDAAHRMIQIQTETYFRGNEKGGQHEDFTDNNHSEERHLRLKTGGPVFDTEEYDVIRAAYISIVAELVSALHPNSIVPYCSTLLQLGVNALQLDGSRLVRRAAALLCRELYSCALREARSQDNDKSQASSIAFTLALLSNGEDILQATLQRCVVAEDVDIAPSSRAVSGKTRLFDSATVARCKEALGTRQELEDSGVIYTGSIVLQTQKTNESNPVARFLSRELKDSNTKVILDMSDPN